MKWKHVWYGIALSAGATTIAGAQSPDEAAVRSAVEHYLQAHATGDGTHHKMVFHDVANLFWIDGDSLRTRTGAEYIAGSSGKPAADEARRKRWIDKVDVTGTAATAKVILDYPTVRFTDYFALLKVEGEWKIVTKIFHREPKPAP